MDPSPSTTPTPPEDDDLADLVAWLSEQSQPRLDAIAEGGLYGQNWADFCDWCEANSVPPGVMALTLWLDVEGEHVTADAQAHLLALARDRDEPTP